MLPCRLRLLRCASPALVVLLIALATAPLAAQTADAGPDQTVPAGPECSAVVLLDGSATVLPEPDPEAPEEVTFTFTWTGPFAEGEGMVDGVTAEVTLPGGDHVVMLTVTSSAGVVSEDTVAISVADQTPPVIASASASPHTIWPPNHKMIESRVSIDVSDDCDEDPVCEIVDIESSESDNGRGDGNTSDDAAVTGTMSVRLRAERSGGGSGRVYTIHVRCVDDAGNESTGQVVVRVPHDGRGFSGRSTGSDPSTGTGPTTGTSTDDVPVPPRDDLTKCAVRVDFDDIENNRFLGILDVAATQDDVPANETASRRDDLEGYRLFVLLGDEEVSGVVDAGGAVRGVDNFRARWVPEVGRLIVDVRGIDLAGLLSINHLLDGNDMRLDVPVLVFATPPEVSEGAGGQAIVLFDDILACEYRQRAEVAGKAKLPKSKGGKKGKKNGR